MHTPNKSSKPHRHYGTPRPIVSLNHPYFINKNYTSHSYDNKSFRNTYMTEWMQSQQEYILKQESKVQHMLRMWTCNNYVYIQTVLRSVDLNTEHAKLRSDFLNTYCRFLNNCFESTISEKMITDVMDMLSLFEEIIIQAPRFLVPEYIYFYRGLYDDRADSTFLTKLRDMDVNETYTEHGFSALSCKFEKAQMFSKTSSVVLIIKVPSNSSILYMDPMSKYPVGQFLLCYGSVFRKINRENNVFVYIGVTGTTRLLHYKLMKLQELEGQGQSRFGNGNGNGNVSSNNVEMMTINKTEPEILFR